MNITMRKAFTLLLTAGLLATSCLPAFASSKNSVSQVPSVRSNTDFSTFGASKPVIVLSSDTTFATSENFRLTLGSDAQWNSAVASGGEVAAPTSAPAQQAIPSTNISGTTVSSIIVGANTLDVTFSKTDGFPDNAEFYIPMNVTLQNAQGEHNVTIDPYNSTVSSGKLAYAYTPEDNPANVTVDLTKIALGKRAQPGGNITITESKAGAISTDNGNEIFVQVPESLRGIKFASATVSVTAGDVAIDDKTNVVSSDGKKISIKIDGESSKPSTIKISGITIDSDRTVAAGDFKLEIGGASLFGKIKQYFPSNDDFISFLYGTMITPAPETTTMPKVEFTDKSSNYRIFANGGWTSKQLDAPAFVDNSRVYIPLRAAVEALGTGTIQWNGFTHEAIISAAGKNIRLTEGSPTLEVDGLKLTMDAPCLKINGRLMVPVSQIALALGVKSTWDDTTRTATLSY